MLGPLQRGHEPPPGREDPEGWLGEGGAPGGQAAGGVSGSLLCPGEDRDRTGMPASHPCWHSEQTSPIHHSTLCCWPRHSPRSLLSTQLSAALLVCETDVLGWHPSGRTELPGPGERPERSSAPEPGVSCVLGRRPSVGKAEAAHRGVSCAALGLLFSLLHFFLLTDFFPTCVCGPGPGIAKFTVSGVFLGQGCCYDSLLQEPVPRLLAVCVWCAVRINVHRAASTSPGTALWALTGLVDLVLWTLGWVTLFSGGLVCPLRDSAMSPLTTGCQHPPQLLPGVGCQVKSPQ